MELTVCGMQRSTYIASIDIQLSLLHALLVRYIVSSVAAALHLASAVHSKGYLGLCFSGSFLFPPHHLAAPPKTLPVPA